MTGMTVRGLLWRRSKSDWGIVMATLALVALGLVMILSTSRELPYINILFEGGPDTYFKAQLQYAIIGFVAMLVISRIDYRLYFRLAAPIGVGTLVLLVVMAIVGRFIFTKAEDIGTVGRGQITELAKYGVIIYLAAWLSAAGPRLKQLRTGLLPAATILALSCGLIVVQPDLSMAMLLGVVCLIILFVAGADPRQLVVLAILGIAVSAALIFFVTYRQARANTFVINPLNDPWGEGYQSVRSLVALNNGRLFGLGLAKGIESRNLHSMAHTDFMFAMIAEQLGFAGALGAISLYIWWTARGLRVALRSVDTFGRLVAVGLVSWEACRALLHLAVATNTVPITGTVLPFVSYGGSALMSGLAALGILINISRQANLQAEAPK